ncbi:MAG: beta strand repeat-containing protein, partial [Ferruginibacter sp.]
NLVATAPTGFEVSADGTTYGATASFNQTSGSASGTLRVRLPATAAVTGSYNSQNIVLSSTGATSVNITTAASGNAVSAKALTITANNNTKVYNTSLSLGISAFSYTGNANSETVGSVTLTAAEAASLTAGTGTYNIVPSAATGGTFTASNYSITYTNGTLTVTAKGLTIDSLSASDKNFDGNTNATITGTATLVGVVNGDVVSLSGTPVGTFASSAVGTGIVVNVTGYILTGANEGNYSLTQPTLSADIIANTPTLFTTGTLVATNAIYGTASAAPTSFNVSAQSLSDVITIAAPSGFEVSTSSAGTYANSIIVGGAGNVSSTPVYVRLASTNTVGNYSGDITLNSTGATQVTIATDSSVVAQKELTITGLTCVDRVYDGTTTASVTGTATLNGVVGSDDVTLNSASTTYAFASATAGSTKAITVSGFSLSGTTAGNYTVSQPTGITATINKAVSTISVTGDSEFTYNNTVQGPNTSSVTGSTGAVTYSYTGIVPVVAASAIRPTNVGTYTVAATVATDINYEAATSTDFSFSIAKADQTI